MTDMEYKREFFRKHGGMKHCETSPMNDYGNYVKTYVTEDGGILTEVNGPEYRTEKWFTDAGYMVTDTVKKWRTEIWHTDDAASRIWYSNY